MKDLVIIGAGDFGKEVAWLIEDINAKEDTYNILGFLDDDKDKIDQTYNGYRCIGNIDSLIDLNQEQTVYAVIALQDGTIRKAIVDRLSGFENWETIIHPSVNVSNTSQIGRGCIVCAGSNISVNTVISEHCLFNLSTTIGHDCNIGKYTSAMSGSCICGHVTIGEGAYLATNSTVIPGKKVGSHATVGAGSVVIRNVREDTTVVGVPAKVVRL